MAQIPEQQAMSPEQAFERLQVWFGMQQQLRDLKTAEVLARQDMAAFYFPNPAEGTNRIDIGLGFDLKLVHGFTRNVDEAALLALDAKALKVIEKLKIPMGDLFVQKWTLVGGAYGKLSDEQRAFVDTLLDIKESTPQLAIVPKADSAGQAKHAKAAEDAAAAAAGKFNINTGAEEDTQDGQFFKDADGVWWLLNGDEWEQVEHLQTLEELEAQVAAVAKPKRGRGSRKAKAG